MFWLLTLVQAAFGGCAIDEREFQELVLDAQLVLDRGDVQGHELAVVRIREQVPCMQFVPNPRLWATYLANEAIQAHRTGGDWQGPLAAALDAFPAIDLGVGPGHPMFDWVPEETDVQTVERDTPLWVDLASTTSVPTEGWHLIQRQGSNGWWSTWLMMDAPPDPSWYARPIRRVRGLEVAVEADAQLGVVIANQAHSRSDRIYDRTGVLPGAAAAAWVRTSFWSPFGLTAMTRVGLQQVVDVAAGPSVSSGSFSFAVGVSRTQEWVAIADNQTGLESSVSAGVLAPWAVVRAQAGSLDLSLSGGAVQHYGSGLVRLGWSIDTGSLDLRLGLRSAYRHLMVGLQGTWEPQPRFDTALTIGFSWETTR